MSVYVSYYRVVETGDWTYAFSVARDRLNHRSVERAIHDDHFGWAQKQRRKESALHYHGRTERPERAKITSLL